MAEINLKNGNAHITSILEGKKPFECNVCEKNFSHKSNMTSHMLSVHDERRHLNAKCVKKAFLARIT